METHHEPFKPRLALEKFHLSLLAKRHQGSRKVRTLRHTDGLAGFSDDVRGMPSAWHILS